MWVATLNVEGGSGTVEGAQGPLTRERGLYLDKFLAGVTEFLVTSITAHGACLSNYPEPL